nr:hypothetical protein [Candidatus Sigynarchaeota archaeon]
MKKAAKTVSKDSETINLAGKMDDWGPWGKKEGQWLIFSVGNPEEGHGYALPRSMDDLSAAHIAHMVQLKSGQRYVAHIPYTTDHQGAVAKDWAPRYIPLDEFKTKMVEFIKYFVKIYKGMGLPASKAVVISTHGGNDDIVNYQEEMRKEIGLEKFYILTGNMMAKEQNKVILEIEKLSKVIAKPGEDPDDVAFKITQILTTAGHADHFEHSFAAAINVLDWEKLKVMNAALEKSVDAALEKWPVLGGLGGFLLRGGKYTDAAGTKDHDKYGLWNALRGLRELDNGRLVVMKEVGELVITLAVDYISQLLLNE